MGEFGWAYISGSGASAAGGGNAIQVQKSVSSTTGSQDFTYNIATRKVELSGSMAIDGNVSASYYFGDGSNLTGITSVSIANDGANRVLTADGDGTMSAESNMLFDGTLLSITGNVSLTQNISASAYFGDGSNLTGISSVSIANDGNNRMLTADGDGTMSAESNLTFDGSELILSGTLTVSGSIYAREFSVDVTNKNITNISVTGSTTFGDSSDDLHQFTGSLSVTQNVSASYYFGDGSNLTGITISPTLDQVIGNGNTTTGSINVGEISGSSLKLTGLTNGTALSSSYLALDSNNNVVLTSSSGGGGGSGGTIGAAEDGNYDDGLFTDFTTSTLVGVPIDRFNEVLKILAPTPAPNVQSINEDVTDGITAKLSFGASNVVTEYTSSGTAAGFDAVARTEIYSASTSGENFRLGVYDGSQDITGFINYDVAQSVSNGNYAYTNDAFGNANEGTLKLELNGTIIHTLNLVTATGSGNPPNGTSGSVNNNGSGFINLSVSASSFDGNGAEWYIFKYRTGKYKVAAADQKKGWNYARVIHTLASDNTTNYVEWVNDPSGAVNDLSATNARIENITLVGSKYLSGVQYNTDATANYKVELNNLYRNVYAASGNPITFSTTNSSTPSAQSVPNIGVSEDNTKVLGVTGSLDFNQTTMFNATMSCNVSATHPLKNTLSNAGSAEAKGFLIDTRTLASTNLVENFHDESFRITSASYNTQNSVTADAAAWNSQTHMTGSNVDGHQDGLLFHNQRLYSPVDADIPNEGDFASMLNVESGQPNYSSIVGTRTFYRVVTNSSGVSTSNFKIVSEKVGTTYNNSALGASNAHFFFKVPGTTGWMDISQNFVYGQTSDNNGALVAGASNDVDSGNNRHFLSIGTASLNDGDLAVIKVIADESWSGYISKLEFFMSASNTTPADSQALDDIDADTSGKTAELSFGASNTVTDYSSVNGSGTGSMSDIDTNGQYAISGDRRGVFISFPTITGTLNEDVGSSGTSYTANSFKDAFEGSLVLEVNGTEVHETSLVTLEGITNSFNVSSSGFTVSPVFFGKANNVPFYNKTYRTGSYQIGPGDQNKGWNYARVIHRLGGGDVTTNYVEWVVDPSGSVEDTAVSNEILSDFGHSDVYYQSGIGYFASRPTGSYSYLASNFYRNVYATGSSVINFPTTTRCSISNIRLSGSGVTTTNTAAATSAMAVLNNTTGCEQTTLQVTGTVLFDASPSTSISGGLSQFTSYGVQVNSTIRHPFKNDKTTSTLSKNYFMIYSGSIGSTNENTLEYFGMESYRIVSGNYDTQTEATQSASKWNPSTAMNNGGTHDDGMVTANGHLISPFQIGNKGDTRNVKDSGVLQAPDSNPNYSSLTNSTRTYYRYFKNNTVNDRSSITITLHGSGSMVEKSTALGNNGNFHLEVKVPSDTAWLDAGKSYTSNNKDVDGSGALVGGSSPTPISTGGTSFSVTYNGGSQLGTGGGSQAVVLKLSADKDWIGYIERITVAYS